MEIRGCFSYYCDMTMKHKATEVPGGPVSNPHDRFLKRMLKDLEKARATLEGVLPPELLAGLRLETLRPTDTTYVDSHLREYFSDLVYTCLTREDIPVQITFLFEHKSYPVDFPHLQILRYMLEIWDREAREKQPLSRILPILLYHGKEAWEYRPFRQYFFGELTAEMAQYTPLFDFLTLNLQASSFEAIREQFRLPALWIAFRLMKAIRDEDLAEKISLILEGLSETGKPEGGNTFFETLFV